LAAAIDFILEKAFRAGVCCSAEPPHRLACLSMLERENVSEHIGHSALILFKSTSAVVELHWCSQL
jgi:hypothetical protein